MATYEIRNLRPDDFEAVMGLEREVFGAAGSAVLCPHYVRLCCEFFAADCLIARDGDRAVGYLLCFVNQCEAYCTTLAIHPDYHRTRVIVLMLRRFLAQILDRVDACWFTVEETNQPARALHRMLGAVDTEVRTDFYGPGEHRIVSRIDRARFESLRPRYRKLGLIEPAAGAAADAA